MDGPGNRGSIPGKGTKFVSPPQRSDQLLGPIQSPNQGVSGSLSPIAKGRSVKLTTHLHLVSRL
jgi:hypothetical protein